jgi:hypothetical protein
MAVQSDSSSSLHGALICLFMMQSSAVGMECLSPAACTVCKSEL